MKTALLSASQTFLLAQLGLSGTQPTAVQSQLTDGNVYIKKEITGTGGITNLIDSTTTYLIGTSSFDKQRLPTGTKMALERIRLAFAVVDAADTNPAAGQLYTNKYSTMPAKAIGAHFIITRAGKKILEIPVTQFTTSDNVKGMICEDDCYDLEALRFLQGDEELEIQLNLPTNVQWPANKKIFVSVELLGPRAQA